MLATCLSLLVVSLHAGEVVAIPHATPLVAANRFAWALQERVAPARAGTRAIVTRVEPHGLRGVVEVRVFDGSGRLAWVDHDAPAPVARVAAGRAARPVTSPTGGASSRDRAESAIARSSGTKPSASGLRQRRQLLAIDAAIGSMLQAALRAHASSPVGPVILHTPLFNPDELIVHPWVFDPNDLVIQPRGFNPNDLLINPNR